jgi:hypothetical protein
MKRLFLYFIPHEKNNHRALILKPGFLIALVAFYLLNQLLIKSLTILKPGVLGYSSEITAEKVIELTNKERKKAGLGELVVNPLLSESAQKKANDMFKNDYWAHNSPQGVTPWEFFNEVNYQYSVAGENLAKDFYDTESMMKAWMNSPTHKANIVHSKYQEIGIAVVNGVLDGVKTTLVVQHFGTPLNGQIAINNKPANPIQNSEIPVENNNVLSALNNTKAINPLAISKTIGAIIFILIICVLVVDSYLTLKNNTHRLTGSSATHIGFLLIILMFMLFSHQGVIF